MQQQTITWIQAIFSGIGVLLLNGLVSQGIGPFSFLMASREEKLFMGKSLLLIQRVVREIIIVGFSLLYFAGMFNVNIKKQTLSGDLPYVSDTSYQIVFSAPTYILLVMFFSLFMLFIFSVKFRDMIFRKSRPKIKLGKKRESVYFKGTFLVISGYVVLVSILCGHLLNLLLLSNIGEKQIEQTIFILFADMNSYPLFIFVGIVYRILLIPILKVYSLIFHTKTIATITLVNNEKLENKLILRPSIEGCILIAEHEFSDDRIMLPKRNILYTEFRNIRTVFGREIESKKKKDLNSIILTTTI